MADLVQLKNLAIKSWGQFEKELTTDNWDRLKTTLHNNNTYIELLQNSYSIVCENDNAQIVGMSFLVPHGNPTEIYHKDWSYIRFVTVDPDFSGQGLGRELTKKCIQYATDNNEKIIALHTSELMRNAMHIYESLGFTVLKEIDSRLGKRYWLYTLNIA